MAHRYRLYLTDVQAQVCARHCADVRFVKNAALEQVRLWRPGGPKGPGSAERFGQLAAARQELGWLADGSSAVQQQALRDFDRALSNWWAGRARRPTWWRRGVDESFAVRDVHVRQINRRWAELLVPKHGPVRAQRVRFRVSRPLPAEIGTARITQDRAGRWHVSFTAPQPVLLRAVTGTAIGLDLGVTATVARSDGQFERLPAGLSPGEAQRLKRLERKKARQRKGSNRREQTKHQIARLHARRTDRRKDWIEKTSTRLVHDHDLIALEDLKVINMLRSAKGTVEQPGTRVRQKAGLNRCISEQGWAMLRRRIEDKAATCAVTVIAVPAHHTSQTCHVCGHTNPRSRESQARFRCTHCGHEAHADINAAQNILTAGLAVTARRGKSRQAPSETRTTQEAA